MSFGREMKDFVDTFTKVSKAGTEQRYYNARTANLAAETAAKKAATFNPDNVKTTGANAIGSDTTGSANGGVVAPVSAKDQQERATDYMSYLTRKGESPVLAAAMIGNAWHESAGLNAGIKGDNGNSQGLFQNNIAGRLPEFRKWAAANKRDTSDPYAQLDFAHYDLKTNFPQLYKTMQTAPNVGVATSAFMKGYERPSIPHEDRRLARAGQAFDLYQQSGGKQNPNNVPSQGTRSVTTPAAVPAPARATTPAQRADYQPNDGNADPNAFASNDQYGDDYSGQPEQAAATGGMIKAYQTAGPVTRDEGGGTGELVDEDPDTRERALDYGESQDAPRAQPASTQGNNTSGGNVIADALHGALTFMQDHFGLNKQGAAVGPDPQLQANQRRFMSGEGAMSPEEYQKVSKGLDPEGKLNDAQRTIQVMMAGYNHYLQRGDVASANRYAAAVVQYSANEAAKFADQAVQAGRKGDVQGMVDYAKKAYEFTPDGHTADAKLRPDGNIDITRSDAQSGQPNQKMVVTPAQLFNAAMGLGNKGEYFKSISQAAALHTGTMPQARALQQQKLNGLIEQFHQPSSDDAPTSSGNPQHPSAVPAAPAGGQTTPAAATPSATPPTQVSAPSSSTPASPSAVPAPAGPGPATSGGAGDVPPAATPVSAQGATPQSALPTDPGNTPLPDVQYPTITPFEQLHPRPQLTQAQQKAFNQMAAINPTLARQEYAKFMQPWEDAKVAYEKSATKQADVQYKQSQLDRQEAVRQRGQAAIQGRTDTTQKNIADRQMTMEQAKLDEQKRREDVLKPKPNSAEVNALSDKVEETLPELLTQMVDPSTGKPFEDTATAIKGLTKTTYNSIRDLAIDIAHYNGIPEKSAAYLAMSMTAADPADPKAVNYEVLKPDRNGNLMYQTADGRTIKLPKTYQPQIDKIRDKRVDIAKKAAEKIKADAAKPPKDYGIPDMAAGIKGFFTPGPGRPGRGAAISQQPAGPYRPVRNRMGAIIDNSRNEPLMPAAKPTPPVTPPGYYQPPRGGAPIPLINRLNGDNSQ